VTAAARRSALAHLAAADDRLGAPWRSLAPDRTHARPLAELGRALVEPDADEAAVDAFAEGLAAIALAMHDAFPHNIFGDLDHLAACLWRGAAAAPEGAAAFLRRQCACVTELQHLFGRSTSIRFRYVHDFLYGFDWAKWVAREPGARARVGPFSPTFLAAMRTRGHELLVVIAEGRHRRYPPLPDARPRNAFGFSREPADEVTLHRQLACEGLLPVEAWRLDAQPRWDRPFQDLRRDHAARLGLLDDAPHRAADRPV
jgi:hypothetical protein